MTRAVIIGGGIGGLATANLLASGGYDVTVYEKQAALGGRAGRLQLHGFIFDTGPSWYLMPEVFEHYFKLLGKDIGQLLQLQRLNPAYKVFFEHQSPLTIHAELAHDRQTFEAIEAGAGVKLERYLERSGQIYDLALNNFLYTNFDKPAALLKPEILRQLPGLVGALTKPIDKYVGGYFDDHRLRQIMEYPMVFLGTSPFEAPAMYSLMSHMDFRQGVFYPQGGLYTIIEALVGIGEGLGVQYRTEAPVKRIVTVQDRAGAIELTDGTMVEADLVISNADLHFTETSLLPPEARTYDESYWHKRQAGPSALLMYLGVRGQLPQLEQHNLLFTDNWRANFGAIFNDKRWPRPASIYVCKPSATDRTVAPEGHENLFVLVPAPAGLETSAEELSQLARQYRQQIMAMVGADDLEERIVVQRLVGPQDFANDFNSWQGTALGLSHRLTQSALFRPANKSKKLSNLYYVGGNTMPGVGLPMCLIGAELVYKRLLQDHSLRPLDRLPELPHV